MYYQHHAEPASDCPGAAPLQDELWSVGESPARQLPRLSPALSGRARASDFTPEYPGFGLKYAPNCRAETSEGVCVDPHLDMIKKAQ
jgi:hypothetical protein